MFYKQNTTVKLHDDKVMSRNEFLIKLVEEGAYTLRRVDEKWVEENSDEYCKIALLAVKIYSHALKFVDKEWLNLKKNSDAYGEIALASVYKNAFALEYVNKEWIGENSEKYYKITLAAVTENGYVLGHVDENWASKKLQLYYRIAIAAVNRNAKALKHVPWSWASKKPQLYYDIALVAVNKDGYSLEYVNYHWEFKNPIWYGEVALAAVRKDGLALEFVSAWLKNNQDIVLAALSQDAYAFQYAGEVFRNNIKIAISSLMAIDREYSSDNYYDTEYYEIVSDMLLKREPSKQTVLCGPSKQIVLYLYILSNKNVSNNTFKNALVDFFIDELEYTFPGKFALYKNILKYYLALCDKGEKHFLNKLSTEEANKLHMFLSVADPSALKNSQLATKHNGTITEYLGKNKDNVKCMKNLNMYAYLLPNNLFVVDYKKIIKKINKNNEGYINNNLIKLVLYYFTIEDLLALSNDKFEAKLEVKYLNIDLKFQGPGGDVSTGIQALVDAIKSNNGSLSNTRKYDTFNTTSHLLDIELSLYNKLTEVIEL